MANEPAQAEKKEDSKTKQIGLELGQIKSIFELDIGLILSSLHAKAMDEFNGKFGDYVIVNSAIAGDGKDGKLESAGDQIISIKSKTDGTDIEKKTAVEGLKTYVQWFVGPDFAKNLKDEDIQPLADPQGGDGSSGGGSGGNSGNDDEDETDEDAESLDESIKFKSFMAFLSEAEEDANEEPETDEDIEEDPEEEEAEEDPEDENGEENGEEDEKGDGADDGKGKDSAPGYFITYEMSVPGIPNQSLDKSMKKSAFSLFDDLKITPHGIFGSGSSFTVKDVKKTVKNLLGLGGVDPSKLTSDIKSNFEKQFPDNEIRDIDVKDKKTLLKKYGGVITGKDRQAVEKANYSILISVPASNDAQEFINKKVVAAIVTKSIKGVVKKFKHGIEPEDVILVQNWIDKDDPNQARISAFKNKIKNIKTYRDIIGKIDSDKKTLEKVLSEFDAAIDSGFIKNKDLTKLDQPGYTQFLNDVKKLIHTQQDQVDKNKDKKTETLEKLIADIEGLLKKNKLNENLYIVNNDIVGEILGFLFENRPFTPSNRRMVKRSDNQTHDQIMGILFNEDDPEAKPEEKKPDEQKSEEKKPEENKPEENKSAENKPEENKSEDTSTDSASSGENPSNGSSGEAGGSSGSSGGSSSGSSGEASSPSGETGGSSKSSSSGSSSSDDEDWDDFSGKGDKDAAGTDLYIVPMPGLKYPDEEDTWSDDEH